MGRGMTKFWGNRLALTRERSKEWGGGAGCFQRKEEKKLDRLLEIVRKL